MKTFKGTKGEWKYQVNAGRILFTNPNMDLWFKQSDNNFDNTKDEVLANAKLIASAPELLEALSELIYLHACEQEGISSGQPTFQQWIEATEKGQKAINKALGQ